MNGSKKIRFTEVTEGILYLIMKIHCPQLYKLNNKVTV